MYKIIINSIKIHVNQNLMGESGIMTSTRGGGMKNSEPLKAV
jgi:hypothetical protein